MTDTKTPRRLDLDAQVSSPYTRESVEAQRGWGVLALVGFAIMIPMEALIMWQGHWGQWFHPTWSVGDNLISAMFYFLPSLLGMAGVGVFSSAHRELGRTRRERRNRTVLALVLWLVWVAVVGSIVLNWVATVGSMPQF